MPNIDDVVFMKRVEQMIDALRPFAEIGAVVADEYPDSMTAAIAMSKDNTLVRMTFGELRSAYKAMEELVSGRNTTKVHFSDGQLVVIPDLKDRH